MRKNIFTVILVLASLLAGCSNTAKTTTLDSNASQVMPTGSDIREDEELEPDSFEDISTLMANLDANIGDSVFFGKYEQDGSTLNGSEQIEWVVLSKTAGKALLISKYALEYMPYNEGYDDTTWAECSLRKWLNGDFYNSAFNSNEQKIIVETNLETFDNIEFGTDGGNDTIDKVFVFSLQDLESAFGITSEKWDQNNSELKCQSTEYCKKKIIDWHAEHFSYTDSEVRQGYMILESKVGDNIAWWWLRSPGARANSAAMVTGSGSVGENGIVITIPAGGYANIGTWHMAAVRPVLWVALEEH